MGPNRDDWCDFHCAHDHSTEDMSSAKLERIEKHGRPRDEIRKRSNKVLDGRLGVHSKGSKREANHNKEPPLGTVARSPLDLGEAHHPP
ncbi:hypothetical protein CR513_23895, partial [Mucuna pruriens]